MSNIDDIKLRSGMFLPFERKVRWRMVYPDYAQGKGVPHPAGYGVYGDTNITVGKTYDTLALIRMEGELCIVLITDHGYVAARAADRFEVLNIE